jgi:hypothetical protein
MKQSEAINADETQFLKTLADLNSAELAEIARRCRLKASAWLRNAERIEAWL